MNLPADILLDGAPENTSEGTRRTEIRLKHSYQGSDLITGQPHNTSSTFRGHIYTHIQGSYLCLFLKYALLKIPEGSHDFR